MNHSIFNDRQHMSIEFPHIHSYDLRLWTCTEKMIDKGRSSVLLLAVPLAIYQIARNILFSAAFSLIHARNAIREIYENGGSIRYSWIYLRYSAWHGLKCVLSPMLSIVKTVSFIYAMKIDVDRAKKIQKADLYMQFIYQHYCNDALFIECIDVLYREVKSSSFDVKNSLASLSGIFFFADQESEECIQVRRYINDSANKLSEIDEKIAHSAEKRERDELKMKRQQLLSTNHFSLSQMMRTCGQAPLLESDAIKGNLPEE